MIPLPFAVHYVAPVFERMRADDRRELEATAQDGELAHLPARTVSACRFGLVAGMSAPYDTVDPVAVVSAAELWPGVWQVGMVATDRWPEVAKDTARWIRRALIPALVSAGAHRAQAYALADRVATRRWLEWLGAAPEAQLRGFGRNREDFVLYTWNREDD